MSEISNNSNFSHDMSHPLQLNSKTLVQPNSKYFIGSSNTKLPHKKNQTINAVYRDKSNKHLRVNLDYQQYLFTKDDLSNNTANNYGMSIVSIIGDHGTGKSLLADSILSEDYGKVLRGFSKNSNQIINSTFYDYESYASNPTQFFVHRKDTDKDAFLWLYFISSVMILNVKESSSSQLKHFIKNIEHVAKHFKANQGEISRPKLIIALKNSKSNIPDRDDLNKFLDQIQESNLFDRNISTINFPYPGKQSVKQSQLLDVPLAELSPQYMLSVKRISHMLKSSPPKNIMGNRISPKFLSYILDALTNQINSTGSTSSIRAEKIWDDIVEEYGIGYHNYYLKQYTEQLGRQFENQKPRTEYQMFSTLNKLRRSTDKKTVGFQNLNDDPIFQKYRKKVKDNINVKQQQIVNVNLQKSQQQNQKIARALFSKVNGRNYKKKIDEYNKLSSFQTSKANVLVDSFNTMFTDSQDLKAVNIPVNSSMVSSRWKRQSKTDSIIGDVASKQAELKQLENKISQSSINNPENNQIHRQIAYLQNDNKTKQQRIKELQVQYNRLKKSGVAGSQPNKQLQQNEEYLGKLSRQIQKNNMLNQRLRKQKDDAIQRKINDLNRSLKDEDARVQKTMMMQSSFGSRKAEGDAKSVCCAIM